MKVGEKRKIGFVTVEVAVLFIVIILVLIIASSGSSFAGIFYSSSKKIGRIVNLKMVHADVWEGQFVCSDGEDGSGLFDPTTFNFTVEDRELATRVQRCLRSKMEVEIIYRTRGFYRSSQSESDDRFLVNVKLAEK